MILSLEKKSYPEPSPREEHSAVRFYSVKHLKLVKLGNKSSLSLKTYETQLELQPITCRHELNEYR